jgi:hypothetical protein
MEHPHCRTKTTGRWSLERERRFREEAPTSAAQAATIILDGVKADRWRILVGEDAHRLDDLVRSSPEQAYDVDFFERFAREVAGASAPYSSNRCRRLRGDGRSLTDRSPVRHT